MNDIPLVSSSSNRLFALAKRMDDCSFADSDLGNEIIAELDLNGDCFFMQSVDAALALLSPTMAWRRLTGKGCSVYGSSPAAKASVRFDGFNENPARALVAAFLRYKASLAQAKERRERGA